MDATLKSWQTLGLGIIASIFVGLLATVISQSYLWGLAFLFAAIAWLFIGSITKIDVGFRGVPLFLGGRIGKEVIVKTTEGEKVPQATGPTLKEGYHWVFPYLMSVQFIDTRLQVEKIEKLKVYAKDNISIVLDTSITYRINNPHQSLNVGGEGEIKQGINELMEAAIRDVVKISESTELTKNSEHRKTIKGNILKAVREVEKKFGVDIVDAFVGEVALPKKIQEALELKKQNQIYAETRKELEAAGVPKDKLEEVCQLNLGVIKKEIKELKVDVGETTAEAIAGIFGKKLPHNKITRF